MKKINLILIALGIIYIIFNLYSHRALIFSKYDAAYWQDRFDHSQWRMALSPRTLGDDGLYLHEGYQLVKGADPTLLNAEVPPLGKYLIGLSVMVFGNASAYSIITTLLAVVLLYFLTLRLTQNNLVAAFASLFFLFDPLLTSQFSISMLDILQLELLLLFFLLLIILTRSKKIQPDLILAAAIGLTLGLFAETKIGIYIPLLFLVAAWILFNKKRRILLFALFGAGFGLGFLLPYLPYFIQGHPLSEWYSVQKWIVNFYRGNLLAPRIGDVLATLLIGKHRNLYSDAWEISREWSAVWPVITVIGTIGLFRMALKNKANIIPKILIFYLMAMLLVLNLIPFWSRYLLLLLPFFYIGAASIILQLKTRLREFLIIAFLAVNFVYSLLIIFPKPNDMLYQFLYSWENGFFQDVYEFVSNDTKQQLSRQDFHETNLLSFYDGEIEAVTIERDFQNLTAFKNPQTLPLTVRYCTRNLGCFTHNPTITVIKENGLWKVDWQWDYLYPEYNQTAKLKTEVELARRGSIINSEGVLASDKPSFMVFITPGSIQSQAKEALYKDIVRLFKDKLSGFGLELRLYNNWLSDKPRPVGTPLEEIDPRIWEDLEKYIGVTLVDWPTRQTFGNDTGRLTNVLYKESNTLLYSPTSYQGADGFEKEHNETLRAQNGGTLSVVNPNGEILTTLISNEKIDGQDVRIE